MFCIPTPYFPGAACKKRLKKRLESRIKTCYYNLNLIFIYDFGFSQVTSSAPQRTGDDASASMRTDDDEHHASTHGKSKEGHPHDTHHSAHHGTSDGPNHDTQNETQHHDHHDGHQRVHTNLGFTNCGFENDTGPLVWNTFKTWLEGIIRQHGERLCRFKGVLWVVGRCSCLCQTTSDSQGFVVGSVCL